jgi:membrane-associated phospholipid phosphatase
MVGQEVSPMPTGVRAVTTPEQRQGPRHQNCDFTGAQGVFTVGNSGLFSLDVLVDGGAYQGQIGVFSLTGMEGFKLDSKAFAQEAARRAIGNDGQGFLLFDDASAGARFDGGIAGGTHNYQGLTTVNFQAGEKVALILVPNGELSKVARGKMGGEDRPMFSIAAANRHRTEQFARVATNTYGWEDINTRSRFADRDYNDLIIKVAGATAEVKDLTQVTSNFSWNQGELGQLLRAFSERSNAVLEWNQATLEAIRVEKSPPPIAARNLAIVGAAIYDAVNGPMGFYPDYLVDGSGWAGAAPEAAAIQAAYETLIQLYPNQKPTFDSLLAEALGTLPTGSSAVQGGITFGNQVAQAILSARANDGSGQSVPYRINTDPGNWQPTGPVTSPLLPHWGGVTTFGIESGSQFRPGDPPALDSAAYAEAFNLTKDLGGLNSNSRTADQTEIAKFWADGTGTYTPPGHWNSIGAQVLDRQNATLVESARTMGLLNMALADAAIACWDAKYTYDTWRPVTAIRQADVDGNGATVADPQWQPLLSTPPFPEYTSGHSTFSGAAATVLTRLVGDNISFTTNSIGLPGVNRSYTSFHQAAQEAGMSRIYGGIHFMPANLEGLNCGYQVGNYIVDRFTSPTNY